MCLPDGGISAVIVTSLITAAVSAAASGITAGFAAHQQNAVAKQQYNYQKKQAAAAEKAAMDQYYETLSRNNIEKQRQEGNTFNNAQSQIIENMRRQAAAEASGAASGLTGVALQQLGSDYQSAIGGISTNLTSQLREMNQNQFLQNDSARRQTQSIINSNQPQPYFTASPLANGLVAGGVAGAKSFASSFSGGLGGGATAGAPIKASTPKSGGIFSDPDFSSYAAWGY
jgi:hypothetical protein